ncbi:hypothetical protein DDP54_07775 [Cellulomonas sp. WB94]|uniref:hypothetical protein n=1 Tax=Cellulomonas sp. WB94 TaxID=2173174 RepID=UPI000D564844|nr:hypothetical protein [Cellulomonas sp. WB94]PVU82918.1 hypothetical protein DDP54_07775 [Cellulomonas sp. WB94]
MTRSSPPELDAVTAQRLETIIVREQGRLDAALAAGATLALNQPPRRRAVFHRVHCSTIWPQLDRFRRWDEWLTRHSAEQLVDLPLGDPARPRVPTLGGPEILVGVQCRPCRLCAPEALGYAVAPIRQRPVRARELRGLHIGRVVTLSDGRTVGALISVTIRHSAAGTTVTIRTTTGNHSIDPDAYVCAQHTGGDR